MTLITQIGIVGSILSMVAGLIMGYRWGHRDGYRERELEVAWEEGYYAGGDGDECPYDFDVELAEQWHRGYDKAIEKWREAR